MEHFGGQVDFVLHSIGMSPNVRKGKHYTDINYNWLSTTLDVSAISLHKTLAVAKKMDAISEWGSVVALTYIAAQRIFPDYGDMADAKSLLESITRSFGYHYGVAKKVRINTVSQSPTITTAGSGVKGFDEFIAYSESMSPLGNADGQACADYCVSLFSDLTRFVTMQNLVPRRWFLEYGSEPGSHRKIRARRGLRISWFIRNFLRVQAVTVGDTSRCNAQLERGVLKINGHGSSEIWGVIFGFGRSNDSCERRLIGKARSAAHCCVLCDGGSHERIDSDRITRISRGSVLFCPC